MDLYIPDSTLSKDRLDMSKIPLVREQSTVSYIALTWQSFELYLGNMSSSSDSFKHFKAAEYFLQIKPYKKPEKKKKKKWRCFDWSNVQSSKDPSTLFEFSQIHPLIPFTPSYTS